MKIWITRQTGGSLQGGGIERVDVWFFEPCLDVRETNWYYEVDDHRKVLDGVLYGHNIRHNFLYRKENDRESDFGDKLIRNPDGIDFPILLEQMKDERKLQFEHNVFGSGCKVHYRPNNARNLFGYPDDTGEKAKAPDISKAIWDLVVSDFDGVDFMKWDEHEKVKPWWRFCKQLDIQMSLK